VKSDAIKLVHRVIGTKHVYTSPDVPALHVSHADQATALSGVQSALDMLSNMEVRRGTILQPKER
jgi:hypothetical protein